MLKKVSDKIWQLKKPKKYRDYSDEELMVEYNDMRQELADLSADPDHDGEMLIQFLEKYEDLIAAADVLEKQRFLEKMSEKK